MVTDQRLRLSKRRKRHKGVRASDRKSTCKYAEACIAQQIPPSPRQQTTELFSSLPGSSPQTCSAPLPASVREEAHGSVDRTGMVSQRGFKGDCHTKAATRTKKATVYTMQMVVQAMAIFTRPSGGCANSVPGSVHQARYRLVPPRSSSGVQQWPVTGTRMWENEVGNEVVH